MSSVPAVHLEGRVLGESGSTVGALKRLCACVCPLVQQQGSLGAESLSAVRANVSHVVTFMYLGSSRKTHQDKCVLLLSNYGNDYLIMGIMLCMTQEVRGISFVLTCL